MFEKTLDTLRFDRFTAASPSIDNTLECTERRQSIAGTPFEPEAARIRGAA